MKLVILGRDGVINRDAETAIRSPEAWVPLPGSLEAIARLNQAGYTVMVATNQSGIARGLFDIDTLHAMHEKMARLLAQLGGRVDGVVFCPHGPDDGCDCRKPRPGLYREIAERLRVSLKGVPVIGDELRDLKAAAEVDARPILVRTGQGERTLAAGGLPEGTAVHDDLAAAADALLTEGGA
ncbi:MAG TPA: D-glycero-beta-D-manno-heptose 1,7-bisphosphate 7-phosphatase [Thioalkalivibrio sp.]|nr:D-glycero-beta-D-manno-heptose 1,7-bisphosphate 7-phosphatase [Thioalkalivibrio sp.]